MILLLVVDVVGRYIFHKSTLISYDLTAYYLVGITYLGAAYALREGSHIRITVVTDTIRPRTRIRWLFLVDLVALFFIILLFLKSLDLVRYSYETGQKSTSFMGEPMWVPQIVVPIGLGMYILEELRQLMVAAKNLFIQSKKEFRGSRGRGTEK